MTADADLRTERAIFLRDSLLTYGFGTTSVPGVLTIEATLATQPTPLATVWFRFQDNNSTICILQSFVIPAFRRLGLRTFLHERMLAVYPDVREIRTDGGSREGIAWMRAIGYTRHSRAGWIYRRRKGRKPCTTQKIRKKSS